MAEERTGYRDIPGRGVFPPGEGPGGGVGRPGSLGLDDIRELREEILSEYRAGRLELPSLPDVAMKVRRALGNPNQSPDRLARIVQADPVLAARLIQVANSPRYRPAVALDSCRAAILRLGCDAVSNLATGLALRNAYLNRHPRLAAYLRDAWRSSCRVAAISHVLAALTPGLSPERALLAGLVHNIGVLPVLRYLERFPSLLEDRRRLAAIVAPLQGRLGGLLLQHWQFDPQLAAVPEGADDWMRDSGGGPDYVDIVLVARAHARFGTAQEEVRPPPLPAMSAFVKLPVSRLGPDASVQLIEEAQDEIAALMETLQGGVG